MKALEYRFMIPLEVYAESGLMIQRARAQAEILDEVVDKLVKGSQEVDITTAAKLVKRIDIFVENRKLQANEKRGKSVFPVDENKRLGFHDAHKEVSVLVAHERSL